jgi:hypothetical protein
MIVIMYVRVGSYYWSQIVSIKLGGKNAGSSIKSTILLISSTTNTIATVLELKIMITVSAPPQIIRRALITGLE